MSCWWSNSGFYFVLAICITSFTIGEDISLLIKAGQWNLTKFVAAQLMANTSDCFHSMKREYLCSLVGDILFDHILSYTFGSLFIFPIIFYIWVHFTSEPNKFSDWNTSSLIFELTNYHFISWIKVWTIFGVIAISNLSLSAQKSL